MKHFSTGTMPTDKVVLLKDGEATFLQWNFEKVEQPEQDDETNINNAPDESYQFDGAWVYGALTYPNIVAAIVKSNYSDDQVQAIISNYILANDSDAVLNDIKRNEYKAEYNKFQAWRATAKDIATEALQE